MKINERQRPAWWIEPGGIKERFARRVSVAAVLLISMLIMGRTVAAQNRNSGELRGTVVDSTGAAVPGAEVKVTGTSTGVVVKSVTDNSGFYDIPYLEVGNYSASFSKPGFKTFIQTGIELHITAITINATLGVGNVSEQVTVTALPPLLQTESPELSTVLPSVEVSQLPVGANWLTLVELVPGVTPSRGNSSTAGANVSINGGQQYQSSWMIDGAAATLPISYNPDRIVPPTEAIGEIDTSTQGFGADTGNGLTSFNVITKSGTNTIHGSVWEFNQNTIFNAIPRNWTTAKAVKPTTHLNQFGAAVGGPIVKDRLFYFFSYQHYISPSRVSGTYSFPTDAIRSGNFQGLNTIYDPATTTTTGGVTSRTAFANNQLTRFDSVALAIQKFYPEPNGSGLSSNYYFVAPQPVTQNWYDWKVDGNLSPSNHLYTSGIATVQNVHVPSPDTPIDSSQRYYFEMATQISDVWTISPTKLNELRLGLAREFETIVPDSYNKNYPSTIGLPSLLLNTFPAVAISGDLAISSIGSDSWTRLGEDNATASDTFTWIHSKHTIKFGGEYDNWTANLGNGHNVGTFNFNGIGTEQPNVSSTGVGYADFLLGYVQSWSVSIPIEYGGRDHNEQFFIQDAYKVLQNLTLNAGIRIVQQNGWGEEHDRFSEYSPTLTNTATGNLGALGYAGKQIPNTILAPHVFYAPRVGFAWAANSRTSVRGGFGFYPVPWSSNGYLTGVGTGWNITGSEQSTDNLTNVFQLSSGPPTPVIPTDATRTSTLLNGQNIPYIPYHAPMTYVEQYQLSVQRELGNYLVEANYVGSVTRHLAFASDINQATNLQTGVRPNTTYQAINAVLYRGVAAYNALQLTGRCQLSHGFSCLAHYTWAKNLDTGTGNGGNGPSLDYVQSSYDPAANYAASGADIRHTTNGSVLYELPVGKGRRFLNRGGLIDGIAGGWQLSGAYTYHSGLPFTVVVGSANLSYSQAGNWFPNRVGSGKLSHPTLQEWFDTSAFVVPAAHTFGNSRRNILYGPHFADVDLSLAKTFSLSPIREGWKVQFKADAFDIFNHPNYGLPNANLGSGSSYGTITSSYSYRTMQMNAVLRF